MKVKKYMAPSMPEAMKKIRRDLGGDAVILHSREVNKGGFFGLFAKKNLEVIAAVDPDTVSSPSHAEAVDASQSPEVSGTVAQPASDEKLVTAVRRLQSDLGRMKASSYPEPLADIHEMLTEQEVEAALSEELMKPLLREWYRSNESLEPDAVRQLFSESLTGKLAEKRMKLPTDHKKKYLLLVGPTGVGKTTTLAKIAAKAKLEDKKNIAFITADTYRIAAIEQLKAYANILNVPIEVVYSMKDFEKAKEAFADRDLVLVDSAGRNYREASYIDELKELIPFSDDTETWIVLSLASKYRDMQAIYQQFLPLSVDRCVLTKVDETRTYGAAVNFWLHDDVVPMYFTNGQNVPDDLILAEPERLTKWLTGVEQHE